MLTITVPATEMFDEKTEEFYYTKETVLQLEHSLVSISKWESKWHKPFLGKDENRTTEQIIDYIRCMTLTQHVKPEVYYCLTNENISEINKYIDDPMTATTINSRDNRRSCEIITNELIYYWMITCQIPIKCEKWHINRLLMLIQVCNEKNKPGKKMSRKDQMAQQRALNAARRAKTGSKG